MRLSHFRTDFRVNDRYNTSMNTYSPSPFFRIEIYFWKPINIFEESREDDTLHRYV